MIDTGRIAATQAATHTLRAYLDDPASAWLTLADIASVDDLLDVAEGILIIAAQVVGRDNLAVVESLLDSMPPSVAVKALRAHLVERRQIHARRILEAVTDRALLEAATVDLCGTVADLIGPRQYLAAQRLLDELEAVLVEKAGGPAV